MSERVDSGLSSDQEALKKAYRSIPAPSDALSRASAAFSGDLGRRRGALPWGIPVAAAAALVVAIALWSSPAGDVDDHGLPLSPPARQFAIPSLSSVGTTPRSVINFALLRRPSLSSSRIEPVPQRASESSKSIDEV